MAPLPSRGEIWLADLDPTRGHEQAGSRPVIIVSSDILNHGPARLVFVAPFTRTDRGVPFHARINPSEGGVRARSLILCDAVRSISTDRLNRQAWGVVRAATLAEVEDRLRVLLEL